VDLVRQKRRREMVETYAEMNEQMQEIIDLQGDIVELTIKIEGKKRNGGKEKRIRGLERQKKIKEEKLRILRVEYGL